MKGIVFEVKRDGVNVMDQNGCFRFVSGVNGHTTGDVIDFVYEPENAAIPPKPKRLPTFSMNNMSRRFSLVAASFVFFICFSIWISTPYYIDIYMNPSVEASFNRFDRPMNLYGLNKDGAELIEGQKIDGHYTNVVKCTLDIMISNGYYRDGFIFVTIASNNSSKAEAIQNELSLHFQEMGLDNVIIDYCDLAYRKRAKNLGVALGLLRCAEKDDGRKFMN